VTDVFAEHRIDEQILKALDRKVYLPSGGHLVIDRTEAMTVIDVNTGKYTGTGGNLEETVTRNNLEAAEEIVRQLRLRDLGGIIVVDFIDMVLESNRELVLRRLTECLGRDRTKHQVTEITSLGLVQMTRKRIGGGLLEAFSETCECCKGRGVIIKLDPEPEKPKASSGDKHKSAAGASGSSGSARRRARKAAEPIVAEAGAESGSAATAAAPADQASVDQAPAAQAVAEQPAADGAVPADGVVAADGAAAADGGAPRDGANAVVALNQPEIVGYDLPRYAVGEPEKHSNGAIPITPTRLAGPDDPDAVDAPGEIAEGEPVEAGAGARRRGGTRRRTGGGGRLRRGNPRGGPRRGRLNGGHERESGVSGKAVSVGGGGRTHV